MNNKIISLLSKFIKVAVVEKHFCSHIAVWSPQVCSTRMIHAMAILDIQCLTVSRYKTVPFGFSAYGDGPCYGPDVRTEKKSGLFQFE